MPQATRPLYRAVFLAAAGVLVAFCLALPGSFDSVAAARPLIAAPVKWSPELGPVPQANTNTAPALANVSLGKHRSSLLLFWTGPKEGQAGFKISYQTSISLRKDTWSAPNLVASGKPVTRSRPSAAPIGPAGSGQVIVVWKDAASSRLLYLVGQEGKGGILSWNNGVGQIPGATASDGPTVYQPLHSDVVVVTWKAASGRAVDFIVGFPGRTGLVKWGPVGSIPRAMTASTPAITEASTGAASGQLFVLWQVPGSAGQVDFATTVDPVRATVKWTAPRPLSPSVKAGAAPSAVAIGKGTTFPLLIVYRGPAGHGAVLRHPGARWHGDRCVRRPAPAQRQWDGDQPWRARGAVARPGPGALRAIRAGLRRLQSSRICRQPQVGGTVDYVTFLWVLTHGPRPAGQRTVVPERGVMRRRRPPGSNPGGGPTLRRGTCIDHGSLPECGEKPQGEKFSGR